MGSSDAFGAPNMKLDPASAYQALLSRDHRFDGRFFVGVKTTGIYCRPICRVRAPKASSCTFHDSAAAAEAAGFRPCLRCRPELAPGVSLVDSSDALACAAARMLDAGAGQQGLAQLAVRTGVGERHLRRVFQAHFGVSLIAYAQTQRLLVAKRLLTETDLGVAEIALMAGFGSLRRFNLESSVGRGRVCGYGCAGQGAMRRNGCSIPTSCNAAMRSQNRAICPVPYSPNG